MRHALLAFVLLPVSLLAQVTGSPAKTGKTAYSVPQPSLWLKMDECSGTTAIDYSLRHNNFTWSGAAVGPGSTYYDTGDVQTCAGTFDGSSTLLTSATLPWTPLFSNSQFTMSIWVRPSVAFPAAFVKILDNYTPSSGYRLCFDCTTTLPGMNLQIGATFGTYQVPPNYYNPSVGFWTHLCTTAHIVGPDMAQEFFYNGTSVSIGTTPTNTTGAILPATGLTIGPITFVGTGAWPLRMQNLKIFNYVDSTISCPVLFALGPAS